jgi:hypothetical protein
VVDSLQELLTQLVVLCSRAFLCQLLPCQSALLLAAQLFSFTVP